MRYITRTHRLVRTGLNEDGSIVREESCLLDEFIENADAIA